jgi:DNA-binding CsgD family transcriptional regulator
MITKPTFAQLMNERLQMLDDHRNVLSPEKEARKLVIAETLLHGSKCGDQSNSLLDMHLAQITHHYSVYSNRLKHDVVNSNLTDNWNLVHLLCPQEDVYSVAEGEVAFYNCVMSLPPEECMQLVMTNLRRLENKNGGYDLYLIRCKVVECDENGVPWLVLIETFLLLQFKVREFVPLRQVFLVDKKSNKIIQRFETDNVDPLTDKERQVLLLKYHSDITNEAIGLQLNMSIPTVKTHLNQAMEKMCSHTVQMICLLIKFMRVFD